MGIPKFFRFLAERFPLVMTPWSEQTAPLCDHLFLDMNGLIHPCTHPTDKDPAHRTPSEDEMVVAIFRYVENLFACMKPRKSFVLCVDGVAPRAKMNQQRQRRFRSAVEMQELRMQSLAAGESLPDEDQVFDSNCITPGTEFMTRLSNHLKYWIALKLTTDSSWQNCDVIYSGQEVPGEGEHKIMEFIRLRKESTSYTANETFCMYGLDADIIMLSLVSHEPHFILLREEVSFGPSPREKRELADKQTRGIKEDKLTRSVGSIKNFHILHISLLREFIGMELFGMDKHPKDRPEWARKISLETVIDDFVAMCFLVGNDFLPSMAGLSIREGALNSLIEAYTETLPIVGHLTDESSFYLRFEAFQKFFGALMQREEKILAVNLKKDADHAVPFLATGARGTYTPEDIRRCYYNRCFGLVPPQKNDREEVQKYETEIARIVKCYVEGLIWNYHYYKVGVLSWNWYYPYYYAPLVSDLIAFNLREVADSCKFDKGKPFLPFQQLLAVLPPLSWRLVPKPFQKVMLHESSPLKKFYPETIMVDRASYMREYEGTVIIPFIDEEELLSVYDQVMQLAEHTLTDVEKAANQVGDTMVFSVDEDVDVKPYELRSPIPDKFPTLTHCTVYQHAWENPVPKYPDRPVGSYGFAAKLAPDVLVGWTGFALEGFPTFFSRPSSYFKTALRSAHVNLFGRPSRDASRVVTVAALPFKGTLRDLAVVMLGTEQLLGYPHSRRCKVIGILGAETSYSLEERGMVKKVHGRDERLVFERTVDMHKRALITRCGIELEPMNAPHLRQEIGSGGTLLVRVLRFTGLDVTAERSAVARYASQESVYPLHLLVSEHSAHFTLLRDPRWVEHGPPPFTSLLPPVASPTTAGQPRGTTVIYTGPDTSLFGRAGVIVCGTEDTKELSMEFSVPVAHCKGDKLVEPFSCVTLPAEIREFINPSNWTSIPDLARRLKIQTRVLTALVSSIAVEGLDRCELGLLFIFPIRNLVRVGLARREPHVAVESSAEASESYLTALVDGVDETHYITQTPQVVKATKSDVGVSSPLHGADSAMSAGIEKGRWQLSRAAVAVTEAFVVKFPGIVSMIARITEALNVPGRAVSTIPPTAFAEEPLLAGVKPRELADRVSEFMQSFGLNAIKKCKFADASLAGLPAVAYPLLESTLLGLTPVEFETQAADLKSVEPPMKTVIRKGISVDHIFVPTMIVSAEAALPQADPETTGKNMQKRLATLKAAAAVMASGFAVPAPLPVDLQAKISIGDRVSFAQDTGTVPLGTFGVVTRVLANGRHVEVVCDSPFVCGTLLRGLLRTRRGVSTPTSQWVKLKSSTTAPPTATTCTYPLVAMDENAMATQLSPMVAKKRPSHAAEKKLKAKVAPKEKEAAKAAAPEVPPPAPSPIAEEDIDESSSDDPEHTTPLSSLPNKPALIESAPIVAVSIPVAPRKDVAPKKRFVPSVKAVAPRPVTTIAFDFDAPAAAGIGSTTMSASVASFWDGLANVVSKPLQEDDERLNAPTYSSTNPPPSGVSSRNDPLTNMLARTLEPHRNAPARSAADVAKGAVEKEKKEKEEDPEAESASAAAAKPAAEKKKSSLLPTAFLRPKH